MGFYHEASHWMCPELSTDHRKLVLHLNVLPSIGTAFQKQCLSIISTKDINYSCRNKSDKSKVVINMTIQKILVILHVIRAPIGKSLLQNLWIFEIYCAAFPPNNYWINDKSPWNLIATGYVIIVRDYKNLKANPRRGWEKSNSESQKGVATGNTTLGNQGDSDICSFLASLLPRERSDRHVTTTKTQWNQQLGKIRDTSRPILT